MTLVHGDDNVSSGCQIDIDCMEVQTKALYRIQTPSWDLTRVASRKEKSSSESFGVTRAAGPLKLILDMQNL